MKLLETFEIDEGEIVTLVGGGGKTTMMNRLAREVSEGGGAVIMTTTTKIMESEGRKADCLVFSENSEELINKISDLTDEKKVICVVSGTVEEKKLSGLPPELISELSSVQDFDLMIVEGDGAARKPFKAPASHEPVIPSSTDLVIPLVGMDVVGKTLNSNNVHRPKLVSRLAKVPMEVAVTPEIIARVVAHGKGGMKKIPLVARVIPFLNKVESKEDKENGSEVAEKVLALSDGRIEKVVLGRVKSQNPIVEIFSSQEEKLT